MTNVNSEAIQNILDNKVKFLFNKENHEDIYAEFPGNGGKTCFDSIEGDLFQRFLRVEYRRETDGEIVTKFNDFLQAAVDDCIDSGDQKIVSICHRVDGAFNKKLFYSLADEAQHAVVVIPGKWAVVPEVSLGTRRFVKTSSSMPQVVPRRGGDYLRLLKPYINLDKNSFLLFAVWLVHCLCKSSSHFGLLVSGGQGTGKSTLTELIQRLIDPSQTSKAILPRSVRDLLVTLYNSYLLCFDNTRTLSDRFSDILCSAITGATASFRELYTTKAQASMPLHNIIVLNGIDIVPKQSDLAERCLLLNPIKISPDKRRADQDYWMAFEKDRPLILGAMFDALAKAMSLFPSIHLTSSHRMSDAHQEMTAIALALGIKQGDFNNILLNNVNHLKMENRAKDQFLEALFDYLQHRKSDATVSVTNMLDAMRKDFSHRSCQTYLNSLPKDSSVLGKKLSAAEVFLSDVGYNMTKIHKSDAIYVTIKSIAPSKLTKRQKEQRAALMSDDNAATDE